MFGPRILRRNTHSAGYCCSRARVRKSRQTCGRRALPVTYRPRRVQPWTLLMRGECSPLAVCRQTRAVGTSRRLIRGLRPVCGEQSPSVYLLVGVQDSGYAITRDRGIDDVRLPCRMDFSLPSLPLPQLASSWEVVSLIAKGSSSTLGSIVSCGPDACKDPTSLEES